MKPDPSLVPPDVGHTVKELIDALSALGADALERQVLLGSSDMTGLSEIAHVYIDASGDVIIEAKG